MTASHNKDAPTVDVSYVIPIYNETESLPALTAALEKLLDELADTYTVDEHP